MEIKTVVDLLKNAKKKIRLKHNWTQHARARNKKGGPVDPRADSAVAFCAIGILSRDPSVPNDIKDEAYRYLSTAAKFIFNTVNISAVNDGPDGHRKVIKIYDTAIRGAECIEIGKRVI